MSGAAVTNISGGELQLAPAVFDDFLGTALSGNWNATSWSSQGGGTASVTVSGGNLSVAGAEVLSVQAFNAGVQGRVSFAATPYQHFGVATDLGSVSGQSWAMFSTMNTTDTLFARVNNNGATQDVSLARCRRAPMLTACRR